MESAQTRWLVRADLITGVVLLALGIGVLVESYNMPRLAERSINPWTVPGLVPGMLGLVIACLGAVLALRSLSAGALTAPHEGVSPGPAGEARAALLRLALSLVLCLGYAVILLGRLPFWLATGLFVFSFIAAFEWRREDTAGTRAIRLSIAAAIALAAMLAIPFLFERLFLVRLP